MIKCTKTQVGVRRKTIALGGKPFPNCGAPQICKVQGSEGARTELVSTWGVHTRSPAPTNHEFCHYLLLQKEGTVSRERSTALSLST